MPKGQKPYIPQKKRPIVPRVGLTTFGSDKPYSGEPAATRRDDNARNPETKTYTNKPRPALQRGEYLEQEIEKHGG